MPLESIGVQDLLKEATKLPTLPSVAFQVMRLANDPKSAAEDLARIIEADPSLSARVLRIANSAYYGLSKKLDSVKQAIVVLGFNTVRSLSVSAAVMDKFEPKGVEFAWNAYWQHCFAVGLAGRVLARRLRVDRQREEQYFVAGLLHDVGKVVLAQYFPEEFDKILIRLREVGGSFHSVEKSRGGLTHAEVGGFLGAQWNLPDPLVRAIRFHHTPREAPDDGDPIASAIHLADVLIKTRNIGSGGDSDISGLDEGAIRAMGLTEDDLAKIVEEGLEKELKDSREILEIYGSWE